MKKSASAYECGNCGQPETKSAASPFEHLLQKAHKIEAILHKMGLVARAQSLE